MKKERRRMRGTKHAFDQVGHAGLNREIGLRLCQIRQEQNMTLTAAAVGLKVSFRCVEKYESGKSDISVARFLQYCSLLNASPEYALAWITADAHLRAKTPAVAHENGTI